MSSSLLVAEMPSEERLKSSRTDEMSENGVKVAKDHLKVGMTSDIYACPTDKFLELSTPHGVQSGVANPASQDGEQNMKFLHIASCEQYECMMYKCPWPVVRPAAVVGKEPVSQGLCERPKLTLKTFLSARLAVRVVPAVCQRPQGSM
eukprot:1177631-Amphidinium_carterae.1